MAKRESILSRLDKFFWFFLFINPFLDILNGVYINIVSGVGMLDVEQNATLGVTPSLVVRMLVLLVFAGYLLLARERLAIGTALLIGVSWAFSLVSEYLGRGGVALFTDMQYIARFGYNILLVFVLLRLFAARWDGDKDALIKNLDKLVAYTLIVMAGSILLSSLFQIGWNTYADRLGYRGSRGFFYAGNDITAILALLLPLNLAYVMRELRQRKGLRALLLAVPAALASNAMLVIGSKTAFIAVAVTFFALFAASLVPGFKSRDFTSLRGVSLAFLGALLVFLIMNLFSSFEFLRSVIDSFRAPGEIAAAEGLDAALGSGRQTKLREHWAAFKDAGVFAWLFGLGRGSFPIILEMDVFEVLFYYGVAGLFTMLWLYAVLGFQFVRRVIRRIDTTGCALILSLALCTGYLVVAGHILFSVTSGFYYVFSIVYSRVSLADTPADLPLMRGVRQRN